MVLDTYPWLGLSHKCIAQSKINRIPPQKATCFDERRFLSILGMAVNTVYNDTATPQDALIYAMQSYNRTMKENTASEFRHSADISEAVFL